MFPFIYIKVEYFIFNINKYLPNQLGNVVFYFFLYKK